MVVEISELDLVAEAGGIPQESPPHQGGEDRGSAREGEERRDGGRTASEDRPEHEQTAERVQADEGRGQGTGSGPGTR